QPPGPAQPEVPLEQLLVKADAKKGAEDAKKCQVCHSFEKGGKVLTGPPLYGVVGRPKASIPGFNYTAALKKLGANWTLEDLFHSIASPKTFAPGTAMTFAGIPRPTERADVLAFLNSLSDNPQPLNKAALPSPTRAAEAPGGAVAQ